MAIVAERIIISSYAFHCCCSLNGLFYYESSVMVSHMQTAEIKLAIIVE